MNSAGVLHNPLPQCQFPVPKSKLYLSKETKVIGNIHFVLAIHVLRSNQHLLQTLNKGIFMQMLCALDHIDLRRFHHLFPALGAI